MAFFILTVGEWDFWKIFLLSPLSRRGGGEGEGGGQERMGGGSNYSAKNPLTQTRAFVDDP